MMFVLLTPFPDCVLVQQLSCSFASKARALLVWDLLVLPLDLVLAGLCVGLVLSDCVMMFVGVVFVMILFQWVYEAARWAALCGQLRCLNIVAALNPQVLILGTSASASAKCQLAHFAASCGHLHILQFLASANLEGLHYRNGVSTFFLLFYLLQNGVGPAHFACKEGHVDCLEFLARVCPQSFADRDFVRFSQQIIDLNLEWLDTSILCKLQ